MQRKQKNTSLCLESANLCQGQISSRCDPGILMRIARLIRIWTSAGQLSKGSGFILLSTSVILPSIVKIGC